MSAPTDVGIPNIPDNSFSWNELPSDLLLEVAYYLRDSLQLLASCAYRMPSQLDLNLDQVSSRVV